jgi:hypothetical protein
MAAKKHARTKWRTEPRQEMFVRSNPAAPPRHQEWLMGPCLGPEMASGKVTRMTALVTEGIGKPPSHAQRQ